MDPFFLRIDQKGGFGLAGWALALCVSLCMFGCDGCKPSTAALARICTWDVPAGGRYVFTENVMNTPDIEFKARVYYSAYITPDLACGQLNEGLHPLVVFAHGRTHTAEGSYLRNTHLMHHLASWGYICISVDLDDLRHMTNERLNPPIYGIPQRGELILHAIEFMAKECRTPGSLFYEHIDTNRIALVGHSRGGSGVLDAVNRNLHHRPIKAVATISPFSRGTKPLEVPVPHLCLYGSWDGDLRQGDGPILWSRGTRTAPKQLVEIYGANHFHFTDDFDYTQGPGAFEHVEISRWAHHTIAQGMITAWFDRYVTEANRKDWADYLNGNKSLDDTVDYYISYLDDHYLTIDDGTPLATPLKNNLGGDNTANLSSFSDFDQKYPNPLISGPTDYPDYNEGPALKVKWNTNSTNALTFNFPPTDVRDYGYIAFRMCQVPKDPNNPPDQFKDATVTVTDATGGTAQVPLSRYMVGLQYPDASGSIADDGSVDAFYVYKQIMRSFRIPKDHLTGLDFSSVQQVRFQFNLENRTGFHNIEGTIKIDDLEFTN